MRNSCQVFISYRRESGEILARMLYDKLTRQGYDAFYDHEDLPSGPFEEELYKRIDECTDVLVVLAPGSLDRCSDPKDWVRKEISYAIEANKNIIPIMIPGFSFDNVELPEELLPLKKCNGIEANMGYFPAVMEKLTKQYLHSRPHKKGEPIRRINWNVLFMVFILLIVGPLVMIYARYFYTEQQFISDWWNEFFLGFKGLNPLSFFMTLVVYFATMRWLIRSEIQLNRSRTLSVLKLTELECNINEFVNLLAEKDDFGEWEITADLIDQDDSEYIWTAKREGAVIRSFGNQHPDYLCFRFSEACGYKGGIRLLNIRGDVTKNLAAKLLLEQGFNLVWQKESTACYKNGEWKLLLYFYGIRKKALVMELMKGEIESSFEQAVEEAKLGTSDTILKETIKGIKDFLMTI